ncbi:MAG: hypothetical protein IPJ34_38250 [Myxococcales bacterium]|nr:hypothetical protein [Myxococcales bacterium]MBL8718881.1 hypothetical protein [Myxococcales bacterium]
MEKKHIDEENLTVSGVPSTRDSLAPYGVTIAVTKAYGPKGDSLVGISDVTFDGQPAVTLFVKTEQGEGLVHLSPLHGDRRKAGFVDIPAGTRCQLFCPVSKQPLDKVGPVDDGSDAEYYAIYLTPQCSQEAMVAISDIWGHYASRIVDDSELISYWARTHENA